MQYLGKIVGGFLGYQLSHSLFGGLVGIFFGHWLDKKMYEMGNVTSSVFGNTLTRQSLFMQTTFAVLGHLAKSKGRVTEEDIQLANRLMDRMQLGTQARRIAQQSFTVGKNADFPLEQVLREFRQACGQRADLIRIFVEVQIQAALQDGVLDPNEQRILYTIAEGLGLSRLQFEQMMAMAAAAQRFRSGYYQQENAQHQERHRGDYRSSHSAPSLDDAYRVLGVSANDEQNTVKRAYRKLMNEHHPDKLVAKGLPPEMMDVAKEKTQQIQAAYDLICKAKGWK